MPTPIINSLGDLVEPEIDIRSFLNETFNKATAQYTLKAPIRANLASVLGIHDVSSLLHRCRNSRCVPAIFISA